jgi:hypothetical protein
MSDSIPYWWRLAALVLLMAGVAAIDRRRHGERASRWREYGFVLGAGGAGSLFGLLNDLVTSSICPEYFTVGKGLAPGAWLPLRAGLLGMKAGFSAGAVAGAICMYANTCGCAVPRLPWRNLLRLAWKPPALAAAAAFSLPLFFREFDPLDFARRLQGILDPGRTCAFLTVWWAHSGAYLGLILGLVWLVADVASRRAGGSRGTGWVKLLLAACLVIAGGGCASNMLYYPTRPVYATPAASGRLLFRAAGQPKAFITVPGGRHTDAFMRADAGYRRQLVDFFDQALGLSSGQPSGREG